MKKRNNNRYYAIFIGHQNNLVVDNWPLCEVLVKGCKGALFQGFPSGKKREADDFAKNGPWLNGHWKVRAHPKPKPNRTENPTWKTTERKSYRDPTTGVFNKNRAVRKQGPTITGANFKPHIGPSCPFEPDSDDAAELAILASARDKI